MFEITMALQSLFESCGLEVIKFLTAQEALTVAITFCVTKVLVMSHLIGLHQTALCGASQASFSRLLA